MLLRKSLQNIVLHLLKKVMRFRANLRLSLKHMKFLLNISLQKQGDYKSGDPHLKPQKQHSFNLSGNYKWLSFMAYYNYVLDMYMTWYKPYDEVNHPSVLLQTMASVPHSYYCGANIRVAPSFGIWYPNLTASVFYGHDNVDHLNVVLT
jgi:hypothetical protein